MSPCVQLALFFCAAGKATLRSGYRIGSPALATVCVPDQAEHGDLNAVDKHAQVARDDLSVFSRRPSRKRYACLSLALCYILTFTLLASVLHRRHGFPLDDSYIHQTVARNFAGSGELGFIAGRRSSGSTSLLWELIQAGNYRFLGAIDPVYYNIAISYLLLACIGPMLFMLCDQDGLPISMGIAIAISPAIMGNFLWLGMIGMEHLLSIVLSLAGILLWLTPTSRPTRNALLCGAIAGLLTIARPEGAAFAPLLIILSVYGDFVQRATRDRNILLGVWCLFVFLMIGTNFWTSGSVLPATFQGRSWLYFHATGGAHSFHSMLRFLGSWVDRLPRQFSTRFTSRLNSPGDLISLAALITIVVVPLMLVGAVSLVWNWRPRIRALLLWASAQFAIYLFAFPAAGHGGRYQPLVLMLILPCIVAGIYATLTSLGVSNELTVAGVCLSMIVAGASSLYTWHRVTEVGIDHINDTEGKAALWMRVHVPVTARFASFDIGRVSYEWRGQVIDLGGLVDPSYFHYLEQGQVPAYLKIHHVEYLMLPGTGIEDLGFERGLQMKELAEDCSAPANWLLGFRYTIHSTRCQDIYRLPAN
jgi:hypothetical protein